MTEFANWKHKLRLIEFWTRFGGKKNDGIGFDQLEKLKALVECSYFVVPFKRQKSLLERREAFNQGKATMHKMHIHRNSVCFGCGGSPSVRHHIIQLQNGGLNCRKNLVSLCNTCHASIHPWLSAA